MLRCSWCQNTIHLFRFSRFGKTTSYLYLFLPASHAVFNKAVRGLGGKAWIVNKDSFPYLNFFRYWFRCWLAWIYGFAAHIPVIVAADGATMIKALNKGYDETIEIMAIGTNAIDTSGRSSKILIPLHQENTPPCRCKHETLTLFGWGLVGSIGKEDFGRCVKRMRF